MAFECLLDIIALQQQLAREQPALAQRLAAGDLANAASAAAAGDLASSDSVAAAGEQEEEGADGVLLRIARDLLALGELGCR